MRITHRRSIRSTARCISRSPTLRICSRRCNCSATRRAEARRTLWTAPDTATQLQFLTVGSDGNLYAHRQQRDDAYRDQFQSDRQRALVEDVRLVAVSVLDAVPARDASRGIFRRLDRRARHLRRAVSDRHDGTGPADSGQRLRRRRQFNDTFVGVAYPGDIVLSSEQRLIFAADHDGPGGGQPAGRRHAAAADAAVRRHDDHPHRQRRAASSCCTWIATATRSTTHPT